MKTEYEATFINIDKDSIRTKLKEVGAKLIKDEFLQKRSVFHLPKGHEIEGGWLRVRDEGDKVTLSLKIVDGDKIHNQKETEPTNTLQKRFDKRPQSIYKCLCYCK